MILWSTCIFLCHPAIQRACLGAWGYLLLPAAFLPAACAPTACQTWKALARSVPGNHSLGPIYIFCSQSLNYTSPLCGGQSKRPDCYSFSILLSRFLSCLTFYKDFFAWFQHKFSSTIPPAPEREELFEKLCLCVQLVKPYKCRSHFGIQKQFQEGSWLFGFYNMICLLQICVPLAWISGTKSVASFGLANICNRLTTCAVLGALPGTAL